MEAIRVERLKKNYGKNLGVKDVSFSVNEGEIFGFAGPNGAGKSTTLRILMNFIFADGGGAFIRGLDAAKDSRTIKTFTGYVPSDVRLYGGMRVRELLKRNARFYENARGDDTERLCALFKLETEKRVSALSTGNKKKVALVCALSFKPHVIILDEPTAGLDPMVQKDLFEELKAQAASGAAVLLSSHNLAEVQENCDRVAFIRAGEIAAVSNRSDARGLRKIVTTFKGGEAPEGLTLLSSEKDRRVFYTGEDGPALLQLLSALAPDSFTVAHESLEERFMALYRGEGK